MDDLRIGAAFRSVRVRRGWRQEDVARRAGVSRALISLLERGHIGSTSIQTLRRIGAALEIRVDVVPRWRGSELARLLNVRHSLLHEEVARHLGSLDGWLLAPEVSFSIFGERGVIDILAFHPPSGSLLVIELKTAIVDVNELVGSVDRKARLARKIAMERGWQPTSVSRWVLVTAETTNRRRILDHRAMLRAAFPADGHDMRAWLRHPSDAISALSMWSPATPRSARPTGGQRVRIRGPEMAQR